MAGRASGPFDAGSGQSRRRPLAEQTFGDDASRPLIENLAFGDAPPATGALAATEAGDTAAATGTVSSGSSTVTGSLAATEAADTAALQGTAPASGALAATEAADAASASGVVLVRGTVAATEASDIAAASGTVSTAPATGVLAVTEGADTAAASGLVLVLGTLAATEAEDTAQGAGIVLVRGAIAATEGADTAAASGLVPVLGTLAATEVADTAEASGTVTAPGAIGTLSATEAGDTAAATGVAGTITYTLSAEQALLLQQIAQLHGLLQPLAVSPTRRAAGDLVQDIVEAAGTVTITTTGRGDTLHAGPGAMIEQLAALHGITAPLVVTATQRSAGAIVQAIAATPQATTVTRQ